MFYCATMGQYWLGLRHCALIARFSVGSRHNGAPLRHVLLRGDRPAFARLATKRGVPCAMFCCATMSRYLVGLRHCALIGRFSVGLRQNGAPLRHVLLRDDGSDYARPAAKRRTHAPIFDCATITRASLAFGAAKVPCTHLAILLAASRLTAQALCATCRL